MSVLHRAALPAIAAAALFLCFFQLGRHQLTAWDEAAHAEFSIEMLETGNWLDTHIQGQIYFDKPPLITWVTAALFQWFGTSPGVARIPSAMAGVGAVIAVFLLGKRLAGIWAGSLAAVFLLTNAVFLQQSRQVSPDGPLTFAVILAIYLWVRYENSAAGLWGAGLCFCAALMMKQVGAVPPFAGMAAVILWRHRSKGIPRGLVLAAIAGALLASIWHLAMFWRHGKTFWDSYFGYHVLGRIQRTMTVGQHPWYQYLLWLLLRYPFSLFAGLRMPRAEAFVLAATALATVFAYSLAANRIIWYISPAIPPLAVLAAAAVVTDLRERQGRYTLLVAAILAAWSANDRWFMAGVAVAGGIVLVLTAAAWRWNFTRALAGALLGIALAREAHAVIPIVWRTGVTEADQVAEVLLAIRAPENVHGENWRTAPVATLEWQPAGYYYARRPALKAVSCRATPGPLLACLPPARPMYVLGRRQDVERIPGWEAMLVRSAGDVYALRLGEPAPATASRATGQYQ